MTRPSFRLLSSSIVLLLTSVAGADKSPPAAEKPIDVKDVLSQANAAAQSLTAISYEGEYSVDGDLVGKMPQVSGKVLAVRGAPGKAPNIFIQGTLHVPTMAQPLPFRFACDGEKAYKVDEQRKLFQSGAASDARVSEVAALFPPKYFGSVFQSELTSPSASHDGVKTVDGVECDVVKVAFDPEGLRAIRYFIGKADHLLHRAENTIQMKMPGAAKPAVGRIIFAAKRIDTKPAVDSKLFRLNCPEGFRSEVFQQGFSSTPQNQQGLLASGTVAPNWELKTPEGKTVSLNSLRGQVVVMDFWASWCGPCKMAMPGLQKVHEKFKDKPVTIVGIDCRERTPAGEAAGLDFVRKNALTYTILLKGDEVAKAYNVEGIPCFYIIGQDGKVIYSTSGFQPSLHEYMSQIIEQNLPTGASTAGGTGAVPSAGK